MLLYKCISKLICSRLKEAVKIAVADSHAAFVLGRSMVHNILICHDLLRRYNGKTTPRCLMKMDLRKAYEMVGWEFLEEALVGFGFPDRFIKLIMFFISTPKYTMKINGEGHGFFEGEKGLVTRRSCFSFAICASYGIPLKIAKNYELFAGFTFPSYVQIVTAESFSLC
ncbi:uncharacterized protein LOC107875235 [Capsicum annuum]|uniref:uncharacterized protein LOC107875235 n=1 Tax=Capsicum annuum TaxID=4072 RepID=UPI0007BF436E|nr:uncharacterized protein LOC107875235 [Capsicum annuum]